MAALGIAIGNHKAGRDELVIGSKGQEFLKVSIEDGKVSLFFMGANFETAAAPENWSQTLQGLGQDMQSMLAPGANAQRKLQQIMQVIAS